MSDAVLKNTHPELSVDVRRAPSSKLEQHIWPIKVYTLGRFGLVRDGESIHFSGKLPRKPLELLKLIISYGGRGVSEEQVIDHLWPNTELDAATSAFSSALHRLRQLLGGNVFIKRQDRLISLDPCFCWVDAWAFERLSNQVQSNMPIWTSEHSTGLQIAQDAIAYYTGHFLPSDRDQLWSFSMRERLRGKVLSLITMVGQHWEAASDWHTALAIYQKGIEVDELYEEFYQQQMLCHCRLGNHGEAASIYQRCRMLLAFRGVKPSPRTTSIFEKINYPPK